MLKSVFGLVDCNNFYASCEKLFRPDLRNSPVLVLSNNDGCVVARSPESKVLGIPMGVPVFKIKKQIEKYNIVVFSSNYAFYADMSSRVMNTLEGLAPRVEIYSIDEAFLDLTGIQYLEKFGQTLRDTLKQWTGIQVGVGISTTKTLAKLANYAAKKYPGTHGVVDLTCPERQKRLMALVPVEEVWGIGNKWGLELNVLGVKTALDLANTNKKWLRNRFSVVMERTVAELNGESCLELEEVPSKKKQIVWSRSFGNQITEISQMQEALCEYTARAAEKLRRHNSVTKVVTIFIRSSSFNSTEDYYSNSATGTLFSATEDSRDLIHESLKLLHQIWRPGFNYAKAGVMLSALTLKDQEQLNLFSPIRQNSRELMSAIDAINQKSQRNIIFAGQGMDSAWTMKRKHLSPSYTTKWKDIPVVK
jgi:DNA polymerase V